MYFDVKIYPKVFCGVIDGSQVRGLVFIILLKEEENGKIHALAYIKEGNVRRNFAGYFFSVSVLLIFSIIVQWGYFSITRALTSQKLNEKKTYISYIGLPDLALVSEAHYVRHRSLSDVFSFFGDSPELLEYFPSTFVYHFSPSYKDNPSRIMHEK